jgi:hypothetical protein
MRSVHRTILIVEDDKDLSFQYQLFCQLAINSLNETDVEDINVKSAFNIEQAKKVIDQEHVIFISVDLALQADEINLNDNDRRLGLEPGGMQLLKHLQSQPKQPLSIVVSGETLLSYAKDALQKYRVFAYYQKSDPNLLEEYQHAVKAALFYNMAERIIADIETFSANYNLLEFAKSRWEYAIREAVGANASERSFPIDLTSRIKELMGELAPDAKIPGPKWTERVLRKLLAENDWFLIQARIYNFSSFVESQQSQIGPLLFFTSNLLIERLNKSGFSIDYIGLWRNEVGGPCIIIIIKSYLIMNLQNAFREIDMEFREFADKFTHNQKVMVSGPVVQGVVPELQLRSWTRQEFSDWHELLDLLGNPSL